MLIATESAVSSLTGISAFSNAAPGALTMRAWVFDNWSPWVLLRC